MKTPIFLTRPISAGLFWGSLGGLCLIGIAFLSHRGPIQILPYPFILVAAILFLKFNDTSDKVFMRMLFTGFSSFVLMSLIMWVYVQVFLNTTSITLTGALFSLGMIIATGFISSLLLSILAKPVRQ